MVGCHGCVWEVNMFRIGRRGTPAEPARARPAVRSWLGSLAPLGLWFVEQSQDVLVLALSVAVVESAARVREAGLWGGVLRPHGTVRPGGSSAVLRGLHVGVAAVRRALWRSTVTALGGLTVAGPVPDGPCVVVANHRSHADAPALLAALSARGRPRVAAAADHWFARRHRRYFCRWLVGGFPVRRAGGGREDLLSAVGFLDAEGIVVVFPEGTRGTGTGLGRFHTGAFDLARTAGVPVVPVAISGTAGVLAKNARRCHRSPVRLEFAGPQHLVGPEQARDRIAHMLEGDDPPRRR